MTTPTNPVNPIKPIVSSREDQLKSELGDLVPAHFIYVLQEVNFGRGLHEVVYRDYVYESQELTEIFHVRVPRVQRGRGNHDQIGTLAMTSIGFGVLTLFSLGAVLIDPKEDDRSTLYATAGVSAILSLTSLVGMCVNKIRR